MRFIGYLGGMKMSLVHFNSAHIIPITNIELFGYNPISIKSR